jgi:hypothetical protein
MGGFPFALKFRLEGALLKATAARSFLTFQVFVKTVQLVQTSLIHLDNFENSPLGHEAFRREDRDRIS